MTEMIDMSRFIEAKSDQLNADDLIGTSRTITVTRVTGCDGDQPIAIHYEGDNGKPFKPCKTIRRVLMAIWGQYANEYVGKSMRVYRDDKVVFGGLEVGGIRISHMSHLDKETVVVVMKSKGKKAGMKILPLAVAQQSGTATEQPPAKARQTPAEWVATHIARLKNAASADDLAAIRQKAVATLERLKAAHPELYRQVIAADPASDPAPAQDDDPFGLPPLQEGRTDAHHGEASFDADGVEIDETAHPAAAKSQALIDLINTKESDFAVDNVLKENKGDSAAMPEEYRTRVYAAAETRKAAIKGGE